MAAMDPYRNDAAAHAVGALEGPDRSAFEEHLASGCVGCAEELAAHQEALLALARALPPPRLQDSVRQQALDLAEAPALPLDLTAYAWQEVCPGVKVHVVKEDPARGLRACLVWGVPGAVHPRHRHLGDEVILVLQGTIADERGTYGPGQICRSSTGSVHSERALPGEDCICYVLYHGDLEPVEA